MKISRKQKAFNVTRQKLSSKFSVINKINHRMNYSTTIVARIPYLYQCSLLKKTFITLTAELIEIVEI